MKLIITLCVMLLTLFQLQGQVNISGIANEYYAVDSMSSDICRSYLHIDSVQSLQAGDRVMVIQMQGASITTTNNLLFGIVSNYNNAGNYEFATVYEITGNRVELLNPLTRSYDANGVVQMVKVSTGTNINANNVLAMPWNGRKGGVIAIETPGTLNLTGNINADGAGFRGGIINPNPAGPCTETDYFHNMAAGLSGQKGESIALFNTVNECGKGPNAGGGGGGNNLNSGGAGGGNAGSGGQGGDQWTGCSINSGTRGIGGNALAFGNALNKVFLGSGGGAGDQNDNLGTDGGRGGGIVVIRAGALDGNLQFITAIGENGIVSLGDGAGGGGAGGCIVLEVGAYTGPVVLNASGGDGGDTDFPTIHGCHGPGGGGGGGVIWHSGGTLPITVVQVTNGGAAGTVINPQHACGGTTYGASGGSNGQTLNNLVIDEATYLPPRVIDTHADSIICFGDTVRLWATHQAGDPVNHEWQPSLSLQAPTQDTTLAFPLDTTTYIYTVADAQCVDTARIRISVRPEEFANTQGDTTICEGDSTTLTTNGGISYIWSTSTGLTDSTSSSPVFIGNISATYTVAVTNTFGCVDEDTVKVILSPPPPVSTNADDTICSGDTIALFANGALSYQWQGNDLSSNSGGMVNAFPNATTTYIVTGNTSLQCEAHDSVTIYVGNRPNVIVSNDTSICAGQSAILQASGGTNYTWSPASGLNNVGSSSPTASPMTSTTFQVISQDTLGCADTNSVNLTIWSLPNVTAGMDDSMCTGDSVQLSANGAVSYQWQPAVWVDQPSISNPFAYPNNNTQFTVVGTDGNGCVDSASVVVYVQNGFMLTVSSDTIVCEGLNVNLSASGADSYSWTPTPPLTNSNGANTQASVIDTTNFWVTGVSAYGCIDSAQTTVFPVPTFSASMAGDSVCMGDVVNLTPSVSGVGSSFEYSWNSSSHTFSSPQASSQNFAPNQSQTIDVVINNEFGCSRSLMVDVVVLPDPVSNLEPIYSLVKGESITLELLDVSNVTWSPDEFISSSNDLMPTFTPPRTTTYYYDFENAAGCSSRDTLNIVVTTCVGFEFPNVFTPNGDGVNDFFRIDRVGLDEVSNFSIFNRWGELVFKGTSLSDMWDGTYQGEPLNSDVFQVMIIGRCADAPFLKTSDVTLVR